MWNNGMRMAGSDEAFFSYDPISRNCQIFISLLIRGSGLMKPNIDKFINQDIAKLLKDETIFQKVATTVANIAGKLKVLFGGGNIVGREPINPIFEVAQHLINAINLLDETYTRFLEEQRELMEEMNIILRLNRLMNVIRYFVDQINRIDNNQVEGFEYSVHDLIGEHNFNLMNRLFREVPNAIQLRREALNLEQVDEEQIDEEEPEDDHHQQNGDVPHQAG
jgi:hypothetical protein